MAEATVSLKVRPWLDKQKKFLESLAKYVAYIGGFGCGKTVVLCAKSIFLSMAYPHNRGVIASYTAPKLRDDVISVFKEICPEEILLGGSWDKAFHGTNLDLTFANQSIINFRAPDDPEKIKGPTIGFFGLDEASEMVEDIFLAYRGRLRKTGVRRYGMVASNPESKLHWIYRYWVEKINETPLNQYELFQTPSTENIYLDEDYIEDLKQYPEEWKEKYLEGKFTAFSGQIYKTMDEMVHFVEPEAFRSVFGPTVPEHWRLRCSCDPAENQPTAALFHFRDEEDRSWYMDRYSEQNRVTSQHCQAILRIFDKWGRLPEDVDKVIDPSATARKVEGRSLLNVYHENGLYFRPAESCRREDSVTWGIGIVNDRLWPNPKHKHPITGKPGCPKIFFVMTPEIREAVRFISGYRWTSQNSIRHTGKDRPRKYQDHDADALRYGECEFMAAPETREQKMKKQRQRERELAALDPVTGFDYY